MNWTPVRGIGYVVALIIGTTLVSMGFATFDAKTGMIDVEPFNIYVAAGLLWTVLGAPATALLAVVRGWGKK
jgi:hypothetical protein